MNTTTEKQLNLPINTTVKNKNNCIYAKCPARKEYYRWDLVRLPSTFDKFSSNPLFCFRDESNGYVLYPNITVAAVLGVDPSTAAKYSRKYFNSRPGLIITHAAVPVSSNSNIRNRQSLWTVNAIRLLMNSNPKFKDTRYDEVYSLIYSHSGAQMEMPAPVAQTHVDDAAEINNIMTSVAENLATLKSKLVSAVEEKEALKKKLKNSEAVVQSWRDDTPKSLQTYVNKTGEWDDVFNLTKAGLLNTEQVLSLFSGSWLDENGTLVTKARFQKILRHAFHTPHSTHESPTLKHSAIMANYSVVCHVVCPKWEKPKVSKGAAADAANPAYKANALKHVRPQVRYSFKGIEWLRNNWTRLLSAVKA